MAAERKGGRFDVEGFLLLNAVTVAGEEAFSSYSELHFLLYYQYWFANSNYAKQRGASKLASLF